MCEEREKKYYFKFGCMRDSLKLFNYTCGKQYRNTLRFYYSTNKYCNFWFYKNILWHLKFLQMCSLMLQIKGSLAWKDNYVIMIILFIIWRLIIRIAKHTNSKVKKNLKKMKMKSLTSLRELKALTATCIMSLLILFSGDMSPLNSHR